MLHAVRFVDRADRHDVRTQYLQAHIDWLDRHQGTILVAGSLRHAPGDNAVGGLWIVDAPNRQAIEDLISSDPFWRNGLRESVEILLWSKAFPTRQVLV